MDGVFPWYREKCLTAEQLAPIVAARQAAGEKIVFTNGVFDILHVGHARYLAEARALGDALIVAVNTDASVRGFKGDLRPIVSEDERMEMLAALAVVDYVVPFGSRTPVPVIELVKPALYVKGGDYRLEDLPETPVVCGYGGEVRILSLIAGRSTTNIISKVCEAYGAEKTGGENKSI
ncbi:MAG: D-glycero-beta-D-manno-heptose 1-phosphate adenylyltransferase [Capsulimonas sp.]|uniref:D-glycero-beta-D-manno-heptose 1-phosphate adenylyltransferase n=1 Tax=Capsulimonas sp. TaxID=2494211 RepID=UPI0032665926